MILVFRLKILHNVHNGKAIRSLNCVQLSLFCFFLFEPAIELSPEEAEAQAAEDNEEMQMTGAAYGIDADSEANNDGTGNGRGGQNVTKPYVEPVVVITGQGHMYVLSYILYLFMFSIVRYVQPRYPPSSEPEDEVLELNFTTDPVPSFDDVAHELRFGNVENINRHWARVRLANDVIRI